MKLSPPLSRTRGAALIAVLALIVLMAALVTIFLVRTATERSASASYDAAAGTRLLAETTVNLVQATINEATTGTAATAWASQPGAIRIFNDSGALTRIFRLYSGTTIASSTSSGAVLANDVPPANWASEPATWVDLNKPVTVTGLSGSSSLVFPILDPRDPQNPGSATAPSVLTSLEGFSINSAPGSTTLQPAPMPVRWLYVLRDGRIVTPTSPTATSVTVPGATTDNPITGRIAFWTDDETAKVNINTAAGSFSTWSGTTYPGTWDTPRFRIWMERMLFSENQPVQGEYQRYPGHPATTDVSKILTALGISMTDYPYAVSAPTISPQPNATTGAVAPYTFLPRYTDDTSSRGGSRNTTKNSPAPIINSGVPKGERLYPSAGEALFSPNRASSGISRQQMETGKFFLTGHSRSPETTLFGTPRIAMWPVNVNTGTNNRTTFDNLLAFCATTGTGSQAIPYYFQRSNARDSTSDYTNISRNQELFTYLQNQTGKTIPGFGGTFRDKYGIDERNQILAEAADYIRSTNLYDHSVPASNTTFNRFTSNPGSLSGGKAQVVPLTIGTSRGLGRTQTLSEIGIQIICTADGNSPLGPYQEPVIISTQWVSPVAGSAEDPLYASNLPKAQYLRTSGSNIVGWDSVAKTVVSGTSPTALPPSGGPFPANQTLTTSGDYGGTLAALPPGQKRLQAIILFELASPMMGFDPMDTAVPPAYKLEVSGLPGVSLDSQNPFPNRTIAETASVGPNNNGNGVIGRMSTRYNQVQGTGGTLGFRYLMTDYRTSGTNSWNGRYNGWSGESPALNKNTPYPFVSNPFTVSSGNPMTLAGGFQARLQVPTTSGNTTYQTFNVTFPALSNLPQPDLPKVGISGAINATPFSSIPADWWGFDARIARATSQPVENQGTATPNLALGCVIRSDIAVSGAWSYDEKASIPLATFASQSSGSFTGMDVVRSVVAKDGDYRLTSALETVATSANFEKGPGYDSGVKAGNLFKDQFSALGTAGVDNAGKLVSGANYSWHIVPKVPSTLASAKQLGWDWDSGLPQDPDGAYANKPDEGNTYVNGGSSPYFNRESQLGSDISSYFTANRIISSPAMFGSLPTGVKSGVTWRTLLFRPQATRPQDPATGPKDHLFLDLFAMPVVEPYAISEPFSSDGRVNMNYQIIPFTYINRAAAVRGVLSSELVTRVPKAAAANRNAFTHHSYYKATETVSAAASTPPGAPSVARLPLNLDETTGSLRQFREKFAAWDIFKSPSEICDIYLVPQGYSWASNAAADAAWYGDDFALVGDNVRERPYANIYPRLTTKSNTFTVHYTVQALKNPPGQNPDVWTESRGVVTGELRGSTTLERFLDPADSKIPDYAANPNAASLDSFYQWRVISSSAFAP